MNQYLKNTTIVLEKIHRGKQLNSKLFLALSIYFIVSLDNNITYLIIYLLFVMIDNANVWYCLLCYILPN